MYRADRIRAAMGVKGWSAQKLAEQTGLARQTISLIKRGKMKDVRLSSLRLIVDALDISLQSLFEDESVVVKRKRVA